MVRIYSYIGHFAIAIGKEITLTKVHNNQIRFCGFSNPSFIFLKKIIYKETSISHRYVEFLKIKNSQTDG